MLRLCRSVAEAYGPARREIESDCRNRSSSCWFGGRGDTIREDKEARSIRFQHDVNVVRVCDRPGPAGERVPPLRGSRTVREAGLKALPRVGGVRDEVQVAIREATMLKSHQRLGVRVLNFGLTVLPQRSRKLVVTRDKMAGMSRCGEEPGARSPVSRRSPSAARAGRGRARALSPAR